MSAATQATPPAVAAHTATRIEAAWAVLAGVPDPEVPAVSVCDLGIVRGVSEGEDGVLDVVLTPTYSGCPATEVIEADVRAALAQAGFEARTTTRLHPPWTTDWISEAGREKLRAYGIAPPGRCGSGEQPLRFMPPRLACPHCGSFNTERLSAFGSTACKALWRCRACLEPFEQFKPL